MSSYESIKAMSWHQVAVHVMVQEQEVLVFRCYLGFGSTDLSICRLTSVQSDGHFLLPGVWGACALHLTCSYLS